ncbi:MAG: DUF167 domain-containing protein [Gaiella sp.]
MTPRPTTARLRLKVAPGAPRPGLVGRHGDGWKLRVVSPPERGRANDEVEAVVAGCLGVPTSQVRVVGGRSSRDKVVEVTGLGRDEAERRMGATGRNQR